MVATSKTGRDLFPGLPQLTLGPLLENLPILGGSSRTGCRSLTYGFNVRLDRLTVKKSCRKRGIRHVETP